MGLNFGSQLINYISHDGKVIWWNSPQSMFNETEIVTINKFVTTKSWQEMAASMGCSKRTVQRYMSDIFKKIGLESLDRERATAIFFDFDPPKLMINGDSNDA